MSLSRYLIKWREGEKWRFGIFLKQEGEVVTVDDAIRPINVSIPAKEAPAEKRAIVTLVAEQRELGFP